MKMTDYDYQLRLRARNPFIGALALAISVATITGCAHTRGGEDIDTVTGYYSGHWYGPNPDKPLGELTANITPAGPDQWDALFTATYGGVGEYEVPIEGRREGDRVLFGGDVDLGETSGGVFTWEGEIVDDTFTGTYTSRAINGSFKMQRTEPPAE